MRQTCQHGAGVNEPCGKPAVDFVMRQDDNGDEIKWWLCAYHFDMLARFRQILKNAIHEDRNYKFRPATPGKEID